MICAREKVNKTTAVVRTYSWGPEAQGAPGTLRMIADSNGVYFPAYDPNGNVMGLVKASDGTVCAQYEYLPYGEQVTASGTMAGSNPIRFSTKYKDNETGLYYYGYRYYSSSLGRWLSRDPIEEQGGLNLYGFVNNDPVNYIDPLGKETWVPYPGPGRYISDPPFPGIPPGPGLYDQWNPFNNRANETKVNYREWFEWRFPKSIQRVKEMLMDQIKEMACLEYKLSNFIPPLKGFEVNHELLEDGNYFDIPQTWWEKHASIGKFWIKADSTHLIWKNSCQFSYITVIYVQEHTGADKPTWMLTPVPVPKPWLDVLYYTKLFIPRDVRMAEWLIIDSECCKKVIRFFNPYRRIVK